MPFIRWFDTWRCSSGRAPDLVPTRDWLGLGADESRWSMPLLRQDRVFLLFRIRRGASARPALAVLWR